MSHVYIRIFFSQKHENRYLLIILQLHVPSIDTRSDLNVMFKFELEYSNNDKNLNVLNTLWRESPYLCMVGIWTNCQAKATLSGREYLWSAAHIAFCCSYLLFHFVRSNMPRSILRDIVSLIANAIHWPHELKIWHVSYFRMSCLSAKVSIVIHSL